MLYIEKFDLKRNCPPEDKVVTHLGYNDAYRPRHEFHLSLKRRCNMISHTAVKNYNLRPHTPTRPVVFKDRGRNCLLVKDR